MAFNEVSNDIHTDCMKYIICSCLENISCGDCVNPLYDDYIYVLMLGQHYTFTEV